MNIFKHQGDDSKNDQYDENQQYHNSVKKTLKFVDELNYPTHIQFRLKKLPTEKTLTYQRISNISTEQQLFVARLVPFLITSQ